MEKCLLFANWMHDELTMKRTLALCLFPRGPNARRIGIAGVLVTKDHS